MAGTQRDGLGDAQTKKTKDAAFYAKIGAIGGHVSRGGGFAQGQAGRERARKYGAIGGRHSRRSKQLQTA